MENNKSKSGYKFLICDGCGKHPSSKAVAKYRTQITRVKHLPFMLLTCTTCNKAQLHPIIEHNDYKFCSRLGTGLIYHCYSLVHQVKITKTHIILHCTVCGEKQNYQREIRD